MNVRNDAAAGDGGLDERIKLFVATNRELQVARRDAFHFQIFAGVARELEHFCREILENSSGIDGRSGADSLVCMNTACAQDHASDVSLEWRTFQEPVDTPDGELRRDSKG